MPNPRTGGCQWSGLKAVSSPQGARQLNTDSQSALGLHEHLKNELLPSLLPG